MKYYIHIYGCQMNQSDAERISTVLKNLKYTKAKTEHDADLVVLAACSVRQSAINRVFGKIRNLKKKKVLVTGCILKKDRQLLAEKNVDFFDIKDLKNIGHPEIAKDPEVIPVGSIVLQGCGTILQKGSTARIKIPLAPFAKGEIPSGGLWSQHNYFHIAPTHTNKHTAYIPIMTGCDNYCSYCVVPYTRGREYSRPASEIIDEVKTAIKNGYKRIFLLGQNVNSYIDKSPFGKGGEGDFINFPTLLSQINKLPGNFWITFTSSHPKDLSDKLIKTMAKCEKICPYINLPAQSGSDEILQKMNRHYTAENYLSLIEKLKKHIPDIAISTDIIVGFPGETKKQFQDTMKLFRKAKYDMAFINQYSPRPQTAAFKLKDNITKEEKNQREQELTKVLAKTALSHNKKLVGKTIDVLVTEKDKNGNLLGVTRTMKNVCCHCERNGVERGNLINQILSTKITSATPWHLEGILE